MKNLHELDKFRDCSPEIIKFFGNAGDHKAGAFWVPSKIDGKPIRVIASSGMGWDHVSASRRKRAPNWLEMDAIKRLFFKDDEVAFQLHVPPTDHINHHPYCLHIWRPHGIEIPRPPAYMVGPIGSPNTSSETDAHTF